MIVIKAPEREVNKNQQKHGGGKTKKKEKKEKREKKEETRGRTSSAAFGWGCSRILSKAALAKRPFGRE
jgi:hypothetical protein